MMERNGTIGERLTDFCKENDIAVPEYKFHYKMILVFLKPDESEEGQDKAKDEALFLAYTVHEFGAGKETTPKSKWTVLGYLDSNRYITESIVLSYFVYAASIGYKMCQFWCAAPGDYYYLFNDPMLDGCTRTSRKLLFGWWILAKTNRGIFEGTFEELHEQLVQEISKNSDSFFVEFH
ncbi:hypothetical protein L3Y34_003585 [Caenorhabditis briggsae]|nr:hypothetical protein L3Y34_003585 [Caenorhabditis briggsae]